MFLQQYRVPVRRSAVPNILNAVGWPFAETKEDLLALSLTMTGDFCWSLSFEPQWLDECVYHGFFPMSVRFGPQLPVMTPKLHRNRCLLPLDNLHIKKQWRKRASKFKVTFDTQWRACLDMVIAQHGHDWLCPQLELAFTEMFLNPNKFRCTLHSIEVWEEGKMTACEIGIVLGAIYCSLTGAYTTSNAGSVQLATLGAFLRSVGVRLWDFGMEMQYKLQFGAASVPRSEWVALNKQHREMKMQADWKQAQPLSCRAIIDEFYFKKEASTKSDDDQKQQQEPAVSKNQLKKQLKKQRKKQHLAAKKDS